MAEAIRNALRDAEFSDVFFDKRSIQAGDEWPKKLRRELARSDVVFAVIGPRWNPQELDSEGSWIREELAAAHRQKAVVAPLLVGRDTKIPSIDELPRDVHYLPLLQAPASFPDDPRNPDLHGLVVAAASQSARLARRWKNRVRLGIGAFGFVVGVIAVWLSPPASCGTSDLDVGMAILAEDQQSRAAGVNAVDADGLADRMANVLGGHFDAEMANVRGPANCAHLRLSTAVDPMELADAADLDMLILGNLVVGDQQSEMLMSVTFSQLAVPDAPEVAGVHNLHVVPLGRDVSPSVASDAASAALRDIADLVGAFRLYAVGDYLAAASASAELSDALPAESGDRLVRVVDLIRANSLLLLARDIALVSMVEATALQDESLEIYDSLTGNSDYGRAYLGTGQVWLERCRTSLAAGDTAPPSGTASPAHSEPGIDLGLAAFARAEQTADLDPSNATEVKVKASLGAANLALCAAFLTRDDAMAAFAQEGFEAALDITSGSGRFSNLDSQANIGLATLALGSCDPRAPDGALSAAEAYLAGALKGALPSSSGNIQSALDLVRRAQLSSTVGRAGNDQDLANAFQALLVSVCRLPADQ